MSKYEQIIGNNKWLIAKNGVGRYQIEHHRVDFVKKFETGELNWNLSSVEDVRRYRTSDTFWNLLFHRELYIGWADHTNISTLDEAAVILNKVVEEYKRRQLEREWVPVSEGKETV
jgi:hypothetical protein